MSNTNHLGLPDSPAISRPSCARQYLALRETPDFQQMKLRKVIQAGLTKSLTISKSSHASQYTALRRKSDFQQTKLLKIIQAGLNRSWPPAKQAMQLSPLQPQSRVCFPARSGSPATTTPCLWIPASCAGKSSSRCVSKMFIACC